MEAIAKKEFWEPVVGSTGIWFKVILTFAVCFVIAEAINGIVRHRRCSLKLFQNTVWISFCICIIPSTFGGPLMSRYLLLWTGIFGLFFLILFSLFIVVPYCYWTTRWVIKLGERMIQ